MDKTICRHASIDQMTADEYRYWQSRPVYERLSPASEACRPGTTMAFTFFSSKRLALLAIFVASAISAIAAPPTFYARRDYGNGGGCGGGVALAIVDINGDGNLDIACSGSQILFGDGRGNFVLSGTHPFLFGTGLALADFSGDGILDALSLGSQQGEAFKVALGTGDGGFVAPVVYPVPDDYLL